jgi:hypothetical protein
MNRSKIIAVITGAISIILAIAYLIIVQLLDFRGEMLPAPQSQLAPPSVVVAISCLKVEIAAPESVKGDNG